MEYALLFYFISILENIKGFLSDVEVGCFISIIALLIGHLFSMFTRNDCYNEDKKDEELSPGFISIRKGLKRATWIVVPIFALSALLSALLPTKKDAMLIVAGIGVVEAMKSDTVKSVGSKSVQVVEKWLGEQLAETGKTVKEASKAATETVKETVKDAGKQVVTEAVNAVKK